MGWEVRDRVGRRIATVRDKNDNELSGEDLGVVLIVALIVAPFVPVLAGGYLAAITLMKFGVHELFSWLAGIVVVVLSGWLLWKYALARLIYFGAVTLMGSALVFLFVRSGSDLIWSSFWAILFAGAGSFITWKLYTVGDR